jgi:HAMP domain-containing protein
VDERPAKDGGRFFSIKSSLIGVLALLAALFFLPTTISVYDSHQRLRESRRMVDLLNVGIDLFQAVRNFGYERGRTNVVLSHGGALEEMAANREFIKNRRQEGDQALARALAALQDAKLAGAGETLAALEQVRKKVSVLRQRADAQMLVAKELRDLGLPQVWFAAMSEMIVQIRQLLEVLCREISSFDGPTAVISQLMLTSISMRDECAQEMALLSGVMLSGGPISEEMRLRILDKRGMAEQLWRDMRVWSVTLDSPRLAQLIAKFQELYHDRYLPLGSEVLRASLTGGPYGISQKDFLNTGVAAVEALVAVMGAIVEAGTQRADEVYGKALQGFILNISMLLVGVALIGTASTLVVARVINPLAALTAATRRIAKRDLDMEVPYLGRSDEIGSVAHAVDVLKGNTRQMIADYDALQKSKAELERLLAEVRTLSGLLPICSNCKKIRDDQGYWKQVEVYIGEHSEAQFTHGICPDCVKTLYPELNM